MNRRTSLRTGTASTVLLLARPTWAAAAANAQPKLPDDDFLASAQARIPKHRQAEGTISGKFYPTLFAHPAVQAITWWDFSDLGAWQGAPSGWLRQDMSPKPVYDRLLSLIKGAWWTKLTGTTNERGEFQARAFYGTHRLTAELPTGQTLTKEVHWQRGQKNHFELKP